MRTCGWGIALAVVAGALSVPAAAQDRDDGLRADSAGVPADTVRLRPRRVPALEECSVIGHRVVDGDAAAAALRRYPQCRDARFGSLAGRTLVQLALFGDCHAGYRIDAWRSESRREYRLRVTEHYGGCRSARFPHVWLALPKLPAGWRVAFTEEQGEDRRSRDVSPALPHFGIEVVGELPPEGGGDPENR